MFGNMGGDSGTGVLFTRNPSTGENVLWGEFLVNAQGEDVGEQAAVPYRCTTCEALAVHLSVLDRRSAVVSHHSAQRLVPFTCCRSRWHQDAAAHLTAAEHHAVHVR